MANLERIRAAGLERRGQVAQSVDKPRQRRATTDGTPAPRGQEPIALRTQLSTRASEIGNGIHFTGLASAYEQPYEMWDYFGPYTEVVSHGAGAVSLAKVDLDVTLNIGHDQIRRIASTTSGTLALSETTAGLEVDAPNLDPEDVDVAYVLPKIRNGLITEMSFAFRILRGMWSPDYTEYRIDEYDLHRGDVAIVGYGANPNTSASLRQRGADLIPEHRTRRLLLI